MKNQILSSIILLCVLFFNQNTFAQKDASQQDDRYMQGMKQSLEIMKEAEGVEAWQALANRLERIASAEKDKWLPSYYASFCYVIMSYSIKDGDQKDVYLDKSQAYIEVLLKAYPNNSEIWALQGFIYSARIGVNPMVRGMTFSGKSVAALTKAKELDPENPRPYYLNGQNVLYTPTMFGGGKEKACPELQLAAEKFDNFKPESEISPMWGNTRAQKLAADCVKKD